jgi:hypothetical protein
MITNLIETPKYTYDVECDICGSSAVLGYGQVLCSVTDSTRAGKYWQIREVCLDCLKAGTAKFPDLLWEHARAIEETEPNKAQKLRQLAKAEWSSTGTIFDQTFKLTDTALEAEQSGSEMTAKPQN